MGCVIAIATMASVLRPLSEAMRLAKSVAVLPFRSSDLVRSSFNSASTTMTSAAANAKAPSVQCIRKVMARKIGVHGTSKNAGGPEPDTNCARS